MCHKLSCIEDWNPDEGSSGEDGMENEDEGDNGDNEDQGDNGDDDDLYGDY